MFYGSTRQIKQSNNCPYFVKVLPAIDHAWSIFPNNYFAK